MVLCHLKNSELDKKFRMHRGRVALRGDAVKDDSGFYAVFTEQSSSASHMTAAEKLDVIPPLPDCGGEASDAVSAYAQEKMEDAPKLLRLPGNAQSFGYVYHDLGAHNHGTTFQIVWYHWKDICTDTPEQDYCGNENSQKFRLKKDWKSYQNGNACTCSEEVASFYQSTWMI